MPSFTFPPEPDRDLLEALGLLLPVTLTVPVPLKRYLENQGFEPHAAKSGYALVDTGAAMSAVADRVMQELDIPPLEQRETMTPHGIGYSKTYNASASFPTLSYMDVVLEGASGSYLGEAEDGQPELIMLIGRDLLRHLVIHYDGPNGRATITL